MAEFIIEYGKDGMVRIPPDAAEAIGLEEGNKLRLVLRKGQIELSPLAMSALEEAEQLKKTSGEKHSIN